jgi:disease resistance protein RPM1
MIMLLFTEGFIQERQGMSSFEIGEGYFNELVNRSMIQMVVKDLYEMLCGCQVHDMVLDLIRSISYEENFVTILDKNEGAPSSSSSHRKVRRLALQNNRTTLKAHMDMQLVRSFISWNFFHSRSSLLSFKLVRVLALHNSYFGELQVPLRNLHHLRYLGLRVLDVDELPVEAIGSLKSLQTLAVERTLDIQIDGIVEEHVVVTMSVGLLTKLLCLRIGGRMSIVPDGIGKLTSLQELQISYQGQEELRESVKFGNLLKDKFGGHGARRFPEQGNSRTSKKQSQRRRLKKSGFSV